MDRRRAWLWAQRLARWGLAAVFLYAGVAKALNPAEFAAEIKNYHFAPWWAVHPTAIVLPWIEIVAGLSLAVGIVVAESVALIWVMLLAFITAAGWALYQGLDIECGCFGGDAKVGWTLIARNVALFALGAVALVGRRKLRPAGAASPSSDAAQQSGNTQAPRNT